MTFRADLHVHTALSPCADDAMTPPAIVAGSLRAGLAMVAICDHNAAGNARAVQQAAAGSGLTVLPGIEIATAEEAHVLALFGDPEAAEAVAACLRPHLPPVGPDYYDRFGNQLLLDSAGRKIGMEDRMLLAASRLDLSAAVELIHRHGGLAVAAHVNRPSFSVLSQLGVFPFTAGLDAVELSPACVEPAPAADVADRKAPAFQIRRPAAMAGWKGPVFHSSDAHFVGEIGKSCTICELSSPTFGELADAVKALAAGRFCCGALGV